MNWLGVYPSITFGSAGQLDPVMYGNLQGYVRLAKAQIIHEFVEFMLCLTDLRLGKGKRLIQSIDWWSSALSDRPYEGLG
jgi:hypothetical protein